MSEGRSGNLTGRVGGTDTRRAGGDRTPEPIDPKTLARLRRRDTAALRDVVDELARPLYRAAREMGFARSDAEDLVQDVFVTFIRTLDHFEGRSRVGTWLFGILHHKARERRRDQAKSDDHDPIDQVFEGQFDPAGLWSAAPIDLERQIASSEIAEAIAKCLERLPNALREVFVLREVQGLTTAEVCNILERTGTHIGVQLHRARTRLRLCLETKGWSGSR